MSGGPDLVAVFLRWTWWRAALHRGWWLVTSVYLVVDADLSASELVLIGAAQAGVGLLFEVPAGVVADTLSRKWSLVLSHVLMGSAMIATGLVTDFGPLVATQMLWGLSWTFASGADVAWITDELDSAQDRDPRAGIPVARGSKGPGARPRRSRAGPGRISHVLLRSGRAQLTGAAAGLVGVGALASLTQRSTAIVLAGAAMLLLGLYVVARFPERRFVAAPERRWSASWSILVRGSVLVRHSRAILLMLGATFLVNGAAASGRLHARRLVDIGLPSDPVVWFTVLGVLTLLVGAAAFRVVEAHIDGVGTVLRGYVVACAAGAAGLVVLAAVPDEVIASGAVLLVAGIAIPLTRTLGTIWVNREASSDVRATVHSFLAQAEYVGVIVCGLGVALVARLAGLPAALVTCAGLFALTVLLIQRLGPR